MTTRFYSLQEHASAKSAWENSCYYEMDFTISDDSSVYEAVQKFAAYDVGCLVTMDATGKFIRVVYLIVTYLVW
jgi:predicted transcriptional regulator